MFLKALDGGKEGLLADAALLPAGNSASARGHDAAAVLEGRRLRSLVPASLLLKEGLDGSILIGLVEWEGIEVRHGE